MVLLVYRLDRLARDSRLAILIEIEVERRGARIMSVQDEGTATQDPQAQLMKTLLQAIAQYQRQITAGLTRAAMNHKLRQGTLKAGLPPYGYTRSPEGTLQPDPVTFPALQAIEAAHANGQPIAEARRAALAALPPDRHLEHTAVSRIYRRIANGNQPQSSTHTRAHAKQIEENQGEEEGVNS
jgi:DNA invertase Pin-like site-specific DNA recombinase